MRSTPRSPKLAELKAVSDPVERAAACQEFIVYARETLKQVEMLRNESIRESRGSTRLTVDDLAGRAGVKRNVVVQALRPR